jgi:hypothetical protein
MRQEKRQQNRKPPWLLHDLEAKEDFEVSSAQADPSCSSQTWLPVANIHAGMLLSGRGKECIQGSCTYDAREIMVRHSRYLIPAPCCNTEIYPKS